MIVLAVTMLFGQAATKIMVSDATTARNHNQPQSIHFWKLD
jgi:hypothetical protein